MKIEILTRNESVKYLCQKISFYQQETTEIKSRIRAAWATFHKYRQESTSKTTCSNTVYGLFDAAISPTICYAAGTWVPNQEHERVIQSTQCKMLRLIIQTKRKYRKIDIYEMCSTDNESGDGQSTTTHNDVDSEVSFEDDADDEIDTTLIEEEDWIEYIKRKH